MKGYWVCIYEKINNTGKSKIIIFFFRSSWKKFTAGIIKIVIVSKLKANKPILFNIWITSIAHEKL